MTALSAINPTLLDYTRELGPDGKIITDIAEVLNLTNPILDDMVITQGNLETGNKALVRTGIPAPTWRKLYGGVQPTKATCIPVVDTCGMLEAYAEVDKALADLGGDRAAFRRNQEVAHIEGMSQEMASTLMYGNETTEPEAFTGLSPRYLLSTGAENSCNVLKSDDAASTNSDIWLVGWGRNTIHGIYPKGSKAGLSYEDLGEQTLGDATNGYYQGLRSHLRWDLGLSVEDWRYAVRIHWGTTLAATFLSAGTGTPLSDLMLQATELIPSLSSCRPVFYMSRAGLTMLRRQIKKETAYNLTSETVAGKHVTMFDGIPVHRTDAILNNLGALTA